MDLEQAERHSELELLFNIPAMVKAHKDKFSSTDHIIRDVMDRLYALTDEHAKYD